MKIRNCTNTGIWTVECEVDGMPIICSAETKGKAVIAATKRFNELDRAKFNRRVVK